MALFGRKKEDEKKTPAPVRAEGTVSSRDLSRVLRKPRITEKAVLLSDSRVYVFEVASDATKYDVRDALREYFKVTPVKIALVTRKPRTFHSRTRGRRITRPGLKKAYVYLKEGDRIELA